LKYVTLGFTQGPPERRILSLAEKIFDVDVETQDLDVIVPLLLYLVASVTYYVIRLIRRLIQLEQSEV